MPLVTGHIDEATLAEYALGPGRSRLSAAAADRVVAHLAVCQHCRALYAGYLKIAEQPLSPPGFSDYGTPRVPPSDTPLDISARNVLTRFEVVRRQQRLAQRCRAAWRGALALAGAVALGAVVSFGAYKRYFAPPAGGNAAAGMEYISPAGANTFSPGSAAAGMEYIYPAGANTFPPVSMDWPPPSASGEWGAELAAFRQSVNAAAPAAALELLDEKWRELARRPGAALEQWSPALIALHEQLTFRAANTSAEAPALLALARGYWNGGFPAEGINTFNRYAEFSGEAAKQEVLENGEPPAAAARAAQRAKAAAWHAEARRQYERQDYAAALKMCEQLLGRYPTSVKAYEGQIIAARCHIAGRRPSGAIACYRRIVADCPDERFARKAAETVVEFLAQAGRHDEAIAECQALRERFTDDRFRQMSFFTEGRLLKEKGNEYYPAALVLLQNARDLAPDSPAAKQAEAWIRALRDEMLEQMLPDAAI